jgi:hypothetical protein
VSLHRDAHALLTEFLRTLAADDDLARELARASARARTLGRDDADNLAGALDFASKLVAARGWVLDLDSPPDPASIRDLASTLARDLASTRDLARALATVRPAAVRTLDGDLARLLAGAHARAVGLGRCLERCLALVKPLDSLAAAEAEQAAGARGRPSPCAGWLAGFAVRLLPPARRQRYREEFAAELRELAGLRRWRQLAYAARLLGRAWELRRALSGALRVPARER